MYKQKFLYLKPSINNAKYLHKFTMPFALVPCKYIVLSNWFLKKCLYWFNKVYLVINYSITNEGIHFKI